MEKVVLATAAVFLAAGVAILVVPADDGLGPAAQPVTAPVDAAGGSAGAPVAARAPEPARTRTSGAADRPSSLEVEVWRVERTPLQLSAELSSVMKAAREVTLTAEVEGRIVAVGAADHGEVKADQLIVQLDPGLLEAAVQRGEAELARSEARRALARLELDRQRNLAQRSVASASELDRASSEAGIADAEVRHAKAQLREARIRLSRAALRAPFPGVVEGLDLEVGDFVRVGTDVARVLDLTWIEAEIALRDREIVTVRTGDAAWLSVEALPDRLFAAEVVGVARAADASSQKYPVKVVAANPDGALLPGMLGHVRLARGEARGIYVPRAAIRSDFSLTFAFVASEAGPAAKLERRRVKTRSVPFRPELYELTAGVAEGEWLVVGGLRSLRDGLVTRARPVARTPAERGSGPP